MKKWNDFCLARQLSPSSPTINLILQFLTHLYEKGLGYVSVNTARSSLSTILGNIDNQPIGSHPLVVRLMKGIANKRPPSCKYDVTWDVSLVLDLFTKWEDNLSLNLMNLSIKLVALLALTTGQRVQTLAAIKVSEIFLSTSGAEIRVRDKLKNSKPGVGLSLSLAKFEKTKICVVKCLEVYIERTCKIRASDYLLISTRSPYKQANKATISRWLKCALDLANIDTTKFSGHSFRHASTSKALNIGVPINAIYKTAGWSEKSKVFAKHYNKPILDNNVFSNSILNCTVNMQ